MICYVTTLQRDGEDFCSLSSRAVAYADNSAGTVSGPCEPKTYASESLGKTQNGYSVRSHDRMS